MFLRLIFGSNLQLIYNQQSEMSEYSVEAILDRRFDKKNQYQYLVKWVGYSIEESTWEPIKNLKYVKDMVKQFDKQQDKKSKKKEISNLATKAPSDLSLESKPTEPISRILRNSSKSIRKLEESEENKKSDKKGSPEGYDEESDEERPRKLMKKQERQDFKSTSPKSKKTLSKRSSKDKASPKEQRQAKCKFQNIPDSSRKNRPEQQLLNQKAPFDEEGISEKHGKDTAPSVDNSNEEKLTILGMCRGCNGEYLYYVESSNRLRSYKTRSYMIDNYAESLINFYEAKIVFSDPPEVQ